MSSLKRQLDFVSGKVLTDHGMYTDDIDGQSVACFALALWEIGSL
jgi:hypothetical protein